MPPSTINKITKYMTEEQKKRYAARLSTAQTKEKKREILTELDRALGSIPEMEKRATFDQVIEEAQDNTATISNSGEAQEIVNQLLKKST
jgi:hypothetical protein